MTRLKFNDTVDTSSGGLFAGKPGDVARQLEIPPDTRQKLVVMYAKFDTEKERLSCVFACIAPGEKHHGAGFWSNGNYSKDFGMKWVATLAEKAGVADPSQPGWEFGDEDLIGRTVEADVELDEYEGKKSTRIAYANFYAWEPEGDYAAARDEFVASLAEASEASNANGGDGNGADPLAGII